MDPKLMPWNENQFYIPTLLITGNKVHTTWTSSGGRPISSSASLRAVCTSSLSLGSLFPPGKHTSPPPLLNYTNTHVSQKLSWRHRWCYTHLTSIRVTSFERRVIKVYSSPFFTNSGISTEALGSSGKKDNLSPMSNCFKMAIVASLICMVAARFQQKRERIGYIRTFNINNSNSQKCKELELPYVFHVTRWNDKLTLAQS